MVRQKFGFTMEPWPWIRALLVLGLVVLAVFVWNPNFTIAGLWNIHERGGYAQQNRNGLSALVISIAFIACLESARKRS
jgi:hypothetical protein